MLRFFINLDRSPERCRLITQRLGELELDFTRMSAVDGKTLSAEYLSSLQYPKNDPEVRSRYTRQLTSAEIGCFLSHRKCWEALLASDEDYAAIIEDDLIISDRAKAYLTDEKWVPENVDICRLHGTFKDGGHLIEKDRIELTDGDELIVQLKPKPLGTLGYIISRQAAQDALDHSVRLPCPVDDFLFGLRFDFARRYKSWQLNPSVIADAGVDSDIGSRKKQDIKALKAPFFIRHGLRRMLLERKVKKMQGQGIEAALYFK